MITIYWLLILDWYLERDDNGKTITKRETKTLLFETKEDREDYIDFEERMESYRLFEYDIEKEYDEVDAMYFYKK